MEQLPPLGTSILQVVRPTHQIYNTILQQHAAVIKSTPRKTFSYGSDPRQNLDVYCPASNPSGAGCPILMFLYGGGLVNGAKILPVIDNELAYANIGHFFAEKHGFVVVIPDYRLVPHARFPSGGEDVALAVDWTRRNLKTLGGDNTPRDLFVIGNSAGGVHLSTYLFSPVFTNSRRQVLATNSDASLTLRGVILLSVPVHFEAAAVTRNEILTAYYGDRSKEDSPVGLLKALKETTSIVESLPGINFLSLTGTLDPEEEILVPNRGFVDIWTAQDSSDKSVLRTEIMDGHNHISPPFALSTGNSREEAWGNQVAEFCTALTA